MSSRDGTIPARDQLNSRNGQPGLCSDPSYSPNTGDSRTGVVQASGATQRIGVEPPILLRAESALPLADNDTLMPFSPPGLCARRVTAAFDCQRMLLFNTRLDDHRFAPTHIYDPDTGPCVGPILCPGETTPSCRGGNAPFASTDAQHPPGSADDAHPASGRLPRWTKGCHGLVRKRWCGLHVWLRCEQGRSRCSP